MGKSPVEFDLFANGRFILANGLCNGSFSGAVDKACEDDTSFFQG